MLPKEEYRILSERLTNARKRRLETVVAQRTRHLVIGLENVMNSQNAAALVRTAEAFGVQEVHVVDNGSVFRVHEKITRGTHQWLDFIRHTAGEGQTALENGLAALRSRGYRIAATSVEPGTLDIRELDLSSPVALFFGNEHDGLSREMLTAADFHVHIPMVGFTESLNVSVSCGIALHALTARLRECEISWELGEEDRWELLAKWARKSVPQAEVYLRERASGR